MPRSLNKSLIPDPWIRPTNHRLNQEKGLMKEKKEYQIRIPGRLVPVSKEVYLAYYRMA